MTVGGDKRVWESVQVKVQKRLGAVPGTLKEARVVVTRGKIEIIFKDGKSPPISIKPSELQKKLKAPQNKTLTYASLDFIQNVTAKYQWVNLKVPTTEELAKLVDVLLFAWSEGGAVFDPSDECSMVPVHQPPPNKPRLQPAQHEAAARGGASRGGGGMNGGGAGGARRGAAMLVDHMEPGQPQLPHHGAFQSGFKEKQPVHTRLLDILDNKQIQDMYPVNGKGGADAAKVDQVQKQPGRKQQPLYKKKGCNNTSSYAAQAAKSTRGSYTCVDQSPVEMMPKQQQQPSPVMMTSSGLADSSFYGNQQQQPQGRMLASRTPSSAQRVSTKDSMDSAGRLSLNRISYSVRRGSGGVVDHEISQSRLNHFNDDEDTENAAGRSQGGKSLTSTKAAADFDRTFNPGRVFAANATAAVPVPQLLGTRVSTSGNVNAAYKSVLAGMSSSSPAAAPPSVHSYSSSVPQYSRPWPDYKSLSNIGNSCYMNSTLQILAACPIFVEHTARAFGSMEKKSKFMTLFNKAIWCVNGGNDRMPVSRDMLQQLRAVIRTLDAIFDERDGMAQQDAEECLTAVLGALSDECTGRGFKRRDSGVHRLLARASLSPLKAVATTTPIKSIEPPKPSPSGEGEGKAPAACDPVDLMEVKMRDVKRCASCGDTKEKEAMEHRVHLGVGEEEGDEARPWTAKCVQQLLAAEVAQAEIISDFKCEKCKQTCDVIGTKQFVQFGEYIIVVLKRFCYDENHRLRKLRTPVRVPLYLDMSPFVDRAAAAADSAKEEEEGGAVKEEDTKADDETITLEDSTQKVKRAAATTKKTLKAPVEEPSSLDRTIPALQEGTDELLEGMDEEKEEEPVAALTRRLSSSGDLLKELDHHEKKRAPSPAAYVIDIASSAEEDEQLDEAESAVVAAAAAAAERSPRETRLCKQQLQKRPDAKEERAATPQQPPAARKRGRQKAGKEGSEEEDGESESYTNPHQRASLARSEPTAASRGVKKSKLEARGRSASESSDQTAWTPKRAAAAAHEATIAGESEQKKKPCWHSAADEKDKRRSGSSIGDPAAAAADEYAFSDGDTKEEAEPGGWPSAKQSKKRAVKPFVPPARAAAAAAAAAAGKSSPLAKRDRNRLAETEGAHEAKSGAAAAKRRQSKDRGGSEENDDPHHLEQKGGGEKKREELATAAAPAKVDEATKRKREKRRSAIIEEDVIDLSSLSEQEDDAEEAKKEEEETAMKMFEEKSKHVTRRSRVRSANYGSRRKAEEEEESVQPPPEKQDEDDEEVEGFGSQEGGFVKERATSDNVIDVEMDEDSPEEVVGDSQGGEQEDDEDEEEEEEFEEEVPMTDEEAKEEEEPRQDTSTIPDESLVFPPLTQKQQERSSERAGKAPEDDADSDCEKGRAVSSRESSVGSQYSGIVGVKRDEKTMSATQQEQNKQEWRKNVAKINADLQAWRDLFADAGPFPPKSCFTFRPVDLTWRTAMCKRFNIESSADSLRKDADLLRAQSNVFKIDTAPRSEDIVSIDGDGNCLFRALAWWVTGEERAHVRMRHLIVNFMCVFPKEFGPRMTGSRGRKKYTKKESNRMLQPGEWGTQCELFGAATYLGLDIHTYHGERWKTYRPIFEWAYDESRHAKKTILRSVPMAARTRYALYLTNNDDCHFDVVRSMPPAAPSASPSTYRLIASILHHGPTACSGHYVADVYDQARKQWLHCDDSSIGKLNVNQVLMNAMNFGYVLVYGKNSSVEKQQQQLQHSIGK